jgi:hypothetical protein
MFVIYFMRIILYYLYYLTIKHHINNILLYSSHHHINNILNYFIEVILQFVK